MKAFEVYHVFIKCRQLCLNLIIMVKNMLLLMDGTPEAETLLECSLRIFNNPQNHYKGAFVEGVCSDNLDTLFSDQLLLDSHYTRGEIIEKILHTNLNNTEDFIVRFIKKCDELNIKAKVFLSHNNDDKTLFDESLYNDLFLIGKSVFKSKNFNNQLYKSLETILYNSRCPILILDCNEIKFENIVFVYDGSKRSFDSLKLFIYLLGNQLQNNNLLLFIVVTETCMVQEKNVIEYIKNKKLNFSIQRVYPDTYFTDLLTMLKDLNKFLLVSGINRNEIVEDMAFNKKESIFLKLPCSIFLT